MSRVYFHSPSGEAELWGGERAWLGGLRLDPATWGNYSFGHELSVLDIIAHDSEKKLDQALGFTGPTGQ